MKIVHDVSLSIFDTFMTGTKTHSSLRNFFWDLEFQKWTGTNQMAFEGHLKLVTKFLLRLLKTLGKQRLLAVTSLFFSSEQGPVSRALCLNYCSCWEPQRRGRQQRIIEI